MAWADGGDKSLWGDKNKGNTVGKNWKSILVGQKEVKIGWGWKLRRLHYRELGKRNTIRKGGGKESSWGSEKKGWGNCVGGWGVRGNAPKGENSKSGTTAKEWHFSDIEGGHFGVEEKSWGRNNHSKGRRKSPLV